MTPRTPEEFMEPWHEPHPLEGVRLKIKWAEKHMDAIDSFIPKYEELHPVGIRYILDEASGYYEGRLVAKHPPFLDFGLEVGEFAYQLRSALDNIVFALSLPGLPGEFGSSEREAAERVPFFAIRQTENESAIRQNIRFVDESIREAVYTAIEKHQPYQRGEQVESHPLSVLDEINLRDKHRIVNAAAGNITVSTEGLTEGIEVVGGRANTGDVIVRVPASLDPQEAFHPRLSFQVILQVGRPAGGVEVASLRGIHQYVQDELMLDFIGFFPSES